MGNFWVLFQIRQLFRMYSPHNIDTRVQPDYGTNLARTGRSKTARGIRGNWRHPERLCLRHAMVNDIPADCIHYFGLYFNTIHSGNSYSA